MFGSMSVGIDLGTANILVYVKGKGIVLREPSVVAVDKDTESVLAIGEEAREMIGRTPGNIVAIRPLRDGVIADYDTTESMIRYFLEKVVGRSFIFRPRVMICIPSGVTVVEKRAVQEAAEAAGMAKPSSSQIYYVDLSAPDNVVLYARAGENALSRAAASMGQGVASIVEYFK